MIKRYIIFSVLLIAFAIQFNGCKKDLESVDGNLEGSWLLQNGHCWITIDGNNFKLDDENCNSEECWHRCQAEAKIKNDYIYTKGALGVYHKTFHIDKYPWKETTTIQLATISPINVYEWKMTLTGIGNSNINHETFIGK